MEMDRLRDEKGRFVSATAQNLLEQSKALAAKADELIAVENNPPTWFRDLVVVLAQAIGITPEELSSRTRIVHPTPNDPVLLVDDRPMISWFEKSEQK